MIMLHNDTYQIQHGEKMTKLTYCQFQIFETLFRNKGQIVPYGKIRAEKDRSALHAHIAMMKKRIKDLPIEIETIRNIGYRIK